MRFSLFVGLSLACTSFVQAQIPESPRRTLPEFLELAEKSGPQLDEARAKVDYAHAREDYAASKGLPFGKLEILGAPAPGAEGDSLSGRTLWGSWGPLMWSSGELIQPLYTFGAIGNAKRAARAGREAEEKLLERDVWALRNQISEYYFGYQLAFELGDLAESVLKDLNKAYDKVKNSSSASGKRDADKLFVFLKEAETRQLEARKVMDQARLGMAWRAGINAPETPRWDRANLVAREVQLQDIEAYRKLAHENRPELVALDRDVEARESLANVESALRYPQLFLGGRFTYSVAPQRANQTSPFAYDPSNELSGGVALGLRWNLAFFEGHAKLSQARAEAAQAKARQRFLGSGILAEVEKNYLDVKQLQAALALRADAAAAAKRVFRDLVVAYSLGTNSDAKSLLESLGQHVSAEKSRLEAVFQFNMAAARLEQSVAHKL